MFRRLFTIALILAFAAQFLAAEETVGDILAGHSSDTMIHLTTATEQELATATFPHFTPPHTTPGVFQGGRKGHISTMDSFKP